MALEAAFLQLATAFNTVREALQSLGLTVIEDRPPHDEVLLVAASEQIRTVVSQLMPPASIHRAHSADSDKLITPDVSVHCAEAVLPVPRSK